MLPPESMRKRLEEFFENTLERNGRGRRLDVLEPLPAYGSSKSEFSDSNGDNRNFLSGIQYGLWFYDYAWNNAWKMMCRNQQQDHELGFHANYSFLPPCHISNAATVEDKPNSRGTGTYIPHRENNLRMGNDTRQSEKTLGFQVSKILADANPPSGTGTIYRVSETEKVGSSGRHSLSLEGFPLLPGGGPVPVKVNTMAWKPNGISTSFANLEFGTFRPASLLVGSPLPISSGQHHFDQLPIEDSLSSVRDLTVVAKEKQNSPKMEEGVVVVPPFELRDENEFPPLVVNNPTEKQNLQEAVVVPPFELGDEIPPLSVKEMIVTAEEKQNSLKMEEEVDRCLLMVVPPFELVDHNEFPPLVPFEESGKRIESRRNTKEASKQ